MQPKASKCKQTPRNVNICEEMQRNLRNANICMQKQANASKCKKGKEMQTKANKCKQTQATTRKCKQMQDHASNAESKNGSQGKINEHTRKAMESNNETHIENIGKLRLPRRWPRRFARSRCRFAHHNDWSR